MFIVNFTSCSSVSIFNFEHVIAAGGILASHWRIFNTPKMDPLKILKDM